MAAKILAATQNINADKQNQLKITHLSLVFAAVVCVYWYSMLYDNILAKILSMKIFFQILFVWEENDLVFSSELEKKVLKQQHKKSPPLPPPPPHTHIKIQHAKGSINRSQGNHSMSGIHHVFFVCSDALPPSQEKMLENVERRMDPRVIGILLAHPAQVS